MSARWAKMVRRPSRALSRVGLSIWVAIGCVTMLADAGRTQDAVWQSEMDAAQRAIDRYNHSRARRHLETALAHAEAAALGDEVMIQTMIKLAVAHRVLRHPREAWSLFDRANRLGADRLGDGHPLVATALFHSAVFLADYGQLDDAETYYRRALATGARSLGAGDPMRSDIEENLAMLLVNRGRFDTAQDLLGRSLTRRQHGPEPDLKAIAQTFANLGKLHYRRHQPKQAEAALAKALDLARRSAGPGSPLQLSIAADLLDVQLSLDVSSNYDNRPGVMRDVHKGIDIVIAPAAGDFTNSHAVRVLAGIKQALDLLYGSSSFMVGKLKDLTKNGRPVVIFDPRFPFGSANPLVGAFYPYLFGTETGTGGRPRLPVVIGRNIVGGSMQADPSSSRWSNVDLALTLAHELVGHGLQHLRWGDRLSRGDGECEALLYEYQAHRDLKASLTTEFSVDARRQIERKWCLSFKQFISTNAPGEAALWEVQDLDIIRLTQLFDSYARSVMRTN